MLMDRFNVKGSDVSLDFNTISIITAALGLMCKHAIDLVSNMDTSGGATNMCSFLHHVSPPLGLDKDQMLTMIKSGRAAKAKHYIPRLAVTDLTIGLYLHLRHVITNVDDVMGVGEDPVGEDGSGKVTVQSGWVMEDCLHHMETFSILNAGPLLEEARNVVTEEDGPERKAQVDALTREGRTQYPARRQGARPGQRGAKARRPGQRGAKARRPGQRGAKARRPGQRGAKARRPGQRGAKARRPGQRGAKARRPGQRGAKARRPGQRGAKARRPGQRGAKARRPGQRALAGAARRQGAAAGAARRQGAAAGAARRQGAAAGAARRQGAAAGAARRQGAAAGAARRQDSAYSGIGGKGCITSCGRQPLKTMRSCRNNPSTGFWIPLIWLTAAGCGM
eukprot:jgi/Tetstr1/465835/TSEL_010455.t1